MTVVFSETVVAQPTLPELIAVELPAETVIVRPTQAEQVADQILVGPVIHPSTSGDLIDDEATVEYVIARAGPDMDLAVAEGSVEVPIQAADTGVTHSVTRKRSGDPSSWKRNVAKQKRNNGEQYITNLGNMCLQSCLKTMTVHVH